MFHELDFGGAKRAIVEFAKRLKKNHIVDLYYVDENKDNNIEDFFTNAYWYKFNSKIWKGNNWKVRFYKDTIELIKLYSLHKKIAREIELRKYDCVFVHPSKYTQAPFLLSFLSKKCIYYCQEPLRIIYDSTIASNIRSIAFPRNIYEFLNRRIRKWIDFRNCKNAKIILGNSNFSKDLIEKSYGIRALVCYLGVDTNFFKPFNINKSIDVLFIGNKSKGYDLLNDSLKFFKTKPKASVIFRGNGKSSMSDKELVRVYNKSKVLVALNQNEPFGLIPLEAMACGIPVIAVDEGGYKETVVNERTGYLIPRDAKILSLKLRDLLLTPDKLEKMGKIARKVVKSKWNWDVSTSGLEKILDKSV